MITDKSITAREEIKNFPFEDEAFRRYEDFIRQIIDIYNENYSDLDKTLLPEQDKDVLMKLFRYHINNVGNPDGNCQYGLATRGFELKLLNEYFNYLNLKQYGEKYGYKNSPFYNDEQNPDPDFSFGYFTLGTKEAALWAFKAAKTKFKTQNKIQPVLVPYNKLPISIFDAAFLLDIKKEPPKNKEKALADNIQTAILAISINRETPDHELEEIRKCIADTKRECGDNCFVHIIADSIIDILRLSNGYNIFKKNSPKFYAFPAQPKPSYFSDSGTFFVDTISISNTPPECSSFLSGILITTNRNQKYFNSATVAYIGAEDSTVVGSSNGDFLLTDYYFNQRFPIPSLHLLKDKSREELKKYMGEQKLSKEERNVYKELIEYLEEVRPLSMGYPINQLWNDDQLNGLFELLVKEKLIYNTERWDIFAKLDLAESKNPKTGRPYVEEFEEEILDFYKKEVFFPHNNPDDFEGYITTGGTEGNYTGLYLASKLFGKDAVLFLTNETHYSVSKGASIFDIATQEVNVINEESGNMDCSDLEYKIQRHKAKNPNIKVIINANIATTVKGSIDNLNGIWQALNNCGISRENRWIHCDGALQGNVFPFLAHEEAKKIVPFILEPDDPDYVPIDSIAVSGHKFIGAPFPCGITLYRNFGAEHYKKRIADEILEAISSASNLYHAREVDTYLDQNSLISGSKNYYMTVVIWKRVMQLGRKGFEMLVRHCEEVTEYAMFKLNENISKTGIRPYRNKNCNIITLNPSPSEYVVNKYNLPKLKNSHIDIMPHVTVEEIKALIKDMIEHPINIRETTTT